MSEAGPSVGGDEPVRDSPDRYIGQVIADKYEIHSLIAKGGMGRVYEASQLPLGRRVAVKILEPSHVSMAVNDDYKRRFLREAATYARLEHPNTVTMFDYGQLDDADNTLFIVMERVRGQTLRAIVRRGPVDIARALRIVYCIAMSLREAHALGVIHRDLKPSNVMVDLRRQGRDVVKVLDFGLAKIVDVETTGSMSIAEEQQPAFSDGQTLSKLGVLIGSPGYMSPEQIEGGEVDCRVDFYCLGVILFEMLMGKPPFKGNNSFATMVAHVNARVPSFYVMNPEIIIPSDVESVVRRCLEKSPEDRFQSADELMRAIRDVIPPGGLGEDLGFTTAEVPMPSVPDKPRAESSRSGILAGLAVVGVVIALVLAVQLWPQRQETTTPEPVVVEVPAPTLPQLNITTEPSGAEVWEGNRNHGVTPLALDLEKGVDRQFELRLEGHEDAPFRVEDTERDLDRHLLLEAIPVREPTPIPEPEPIFIER